MSDEASATDCLRAAEAGVVAARAGAGSVAGRLRLAEALLVLADELQDVDFPPLTASGAESLERSLACVSEISDQIGAAPEPVLDDVVHEALHQRCRLLEFLGRGKESETATAALRGRIGGEQEQLARAELLYEQALDAYQRTDEDPGAAVEASRALERLCGPYADVSPPPPDSVIVYVAAGIALSANLALSHGQPAAALGLLTQAVERFGDHPDAAVQTQIEYARRRVAELTEAV